MSKHTLGSTISSVFGCVKKSVQLVENSIDYLNSEVEGWSFRRSVERQVALNEIIEENISSLTKEQAEALGLELKQED